MSIIHIFANVGFMWVFLPLTDSYIYLSIYICIHICRLALGYNFITSLPTNFIELSRLRYLNVRANYMNTFPTILCSLPSLEILDISRNKIRRLPSEPGRLLELRVLSISNNRLRKLPTWLPRLRHLRILKLEGNPINWPPPHIWVMPPIGGAGTKDQEGEKPESQKKAEDRHMNIWISGLKSWIQDGNNSIGKGGDQEAYKLESNRKVEETIEVLDMTRAPLTKEVTVANFNEQAGTGREGEGGVESQAAEGENIDQKIIDLEPQTPGETKRSIGATFLSIEDEGQSEDEKDKEAEEEIVPLVSDPSDEEEQTVALHGSRSANDNLAELDPMEETVATLEQPRQVSPEGSREREKTARPLEIRSSIALQQAMNYEDKEAESMMKAPTISLHHGRNNSLSTVQPNSSSSLTSNMASTLRRGILRNKKSLPDLRQNHGTIISERSENRESTLAPPGDTSSSSHRQRRPSANASRRPPLPTTNSESAASTLANRSNPIEMWPSNATENFDNGGSLSGLSGDDKSTGLTSLGNLQLAVSGNAAVEVERNSYFKRLSTLPASTISKSISIPVLQCIDATRGVLYALSQMHAAFKQYITFASDERMTSQLSRALDIASRSMGGLIDSLDRFDSLSRIKGDSLNPIVVRRVLVSCSESVITFRKIVSLLHLQLKSLQRGADVRYTRTLLLLLYGSLAEIHNSWTVMEPLFKDVMPYLQGHEESSNTMTANNLTSSLSVGHPYTLPSIAEATSPVSPNSARFNTTQVRPLRRRHAGSFSAQDVAHGASMIPSVPVPLHHYEENRKAQRPAALGPFAPPPRSGMYQIQQGDTDGADLSDRRDTSTTSVGTATDPQTPKEKPSSRRIQEEPVIAMSKRTLSNTSGGNVSAIGKNQVSNGNTPGMSGKGFNSAHDTNEALIDDHLVLLLVKITSIAYSVWASINDHLNTLGISAPRSGIGSRPTISNQYVTPDSTPLLNTDSFAASPLTPAKLSRPILETSSSSATVVQDRSDDTQNPQDKSGLLTSSSSNSFLQPNSALLPTSDVANKLRNLRDATQRLIEQTNRLEGCCDKIQEKSGIRSPNLSNNSGVHSSSGEAFKDIYLQCNSFIKSILQISHFIKSLSLEHQFPKAIKVHLAQLTTCARDLTLHLHFLGGPTVQSAATFASPLQGRQFKS